MENSVDEPAGGNQATEETHTKRKRRTAGNENLITKSTQQTRRNSSIDFTKNCLQSCVKHEHNTRKSLKKAVGVSISPTAITKSKVHNVKARMEKTTKPSLNLVKCPENSNAVSNREIQNFLHLEESNNSRRPVKIKIGPLIESQATKRKRRATTTESLKSFEETIEEVIKQSAIENVTTPTETTALMEIDSNKSDQNSNSDDKSKQICKSSEQVDSKDANKISFLTDDCASHSNNNLLDSPIITYKEQKTCTVNIDRLFSCKPKRKIIDFMNGCSSDNITNIVDCKEGSNDNVQQIVENSKTTSLVETDMHEISQHSDSNESKEVLKSNERSKMGLDSTQKDLKLPDSDEITTALDIKQNLNLPQISFHTLVNSTAVKNSPNRRKSSGSNSTTSSASTTTSKSKDEKVSKSTPVNFNSAQLKKLSILNLPVIRLTQGDGDSEKRQVELTPVSITTTLDNNLSDGYSIDDSCTSHGEDFTEYSTENKLYWTDMYEFDDSDNFKVTSHDPVFTGAVLNNENKFLQSDSGESLVSSTHSTSSLLKEQRLDPNIIQPQPVIKKFVVSNEIEQPVADEDDSIDLETQEDLFDPDAATPKANNLFRKSIDSSMLTQHNVNSLNANLKKGFQFKIPPLPPAKRPPGRSKSSVSLSSSSVSSSCSSSFSSLSSSSKSDVHSSSIVAYNSQSQNEDDVISIYAESFNSRNKDFVETEDVDLSSENSTCKTRNNVVKETVVTSAKTISKQSINNNSTVSLKQDISIPNLHKDEKSSQEARTPKLEVLSSTQNTEVAQWSSTGRYSNVKSKVDFSIVPVIFKCLCYYHFTFGSCFKGQTCLRPHVVPKKVLNKLQNLPYDLLKAAYPYAKDRYQLYCETLFSFISGFQQYPKEFRLVTIVDDIFQIIEGDKLPYLKKIISGLEEQGRLFNDIVWEIMFREGSKNILLLDMLLVVVCSRKEALIDNWNLVKNICYYRNQEPLDYKIVQDILIHCNESKNSILCKNVMSDIISCCKVELDAINISTLNGFYALLQLLELQEEADMLKKKLEFFKIRPSCISSNNSFASPPHNFNKEVANNQTNKDNMMTQNYPEFEMCHSYAGEDSNHIEMANNNIAEEPSSRRPSENFFHSSFPYTENMPENNGLPFDDPDPLVNSDFNFRNPSSNRLSSESLLAFSPAPRVRDIRDASSLFNFGNFSASSHNEGFNIHSRSTSPISLQNVNNYEMDGISCASSPILNSRQTSLNIIGRNTPVSLDVFDDCDKQLLTEDMKELKEITVNRPSFEEFIMMINKFKNTPYSNSFVMNVICLFKNNTPEKTCDLFTKVVNELDLNNSHDNGLKHMMRVLCVNTVAVLEIQNAFAGAADILALFYKEIHSLINTNWLSVHKYSYSAIGKYFYFCKIFTKGGSYKLAFNLLTSPELKLLHSQNLWTLQYQMDFDLKFRNDVLREFILSTLANNLRIAMDILLYILTNKNCISEINIGKFYNLLICKMVDFNPTYLEELKSMLPNILEGWHRALTDPVLRGLLVVLVPHASENDILNLYSKCCVRGIYPNIKGCETSIPLTTDMTHEEIYTIFFVYVYKLAKYKYPVNDLIFEITLSKSENDSPKILLNMKDLILRVKEKVCRVLARSFEHTINVTMYNAEPYIKIEREKMRAFVSTFNRRNLPEGPLQQVHSVMSNH